MSGTPGFLLESNDIVTVRKSPVYMAQQRVAIGGEVTFEGPYTLSQRNERLSDLVNRAGGLTDAAYVRGAHLSRKMTGRCAVPPRYGPRTLLRGVLRPGG